METVEVIAAMAIGIGLMISIFIMLVKALNTAFSDPYSTQARPPEKYETAPLEINMDSFLESLRRMGWEVEKPKRKNDEDPESTRHFELGDDGELVEVDDSQEKPKRRED